jgi:hypothetical protein
VSNAPSTHRADAQEDPRLVEARRLLQAELWRRGDLRFKLHETQQRIYDAIRASSQRRHFLLCSRRLGKTYLLVALCIEHALRHPNSRIYFCAPTAKDAAIIATDTAGKLLTDCPPELKPEFREQAKELKFKNGAIVRFQGINSDHANDIRGHTADLVVMDEVGSMDDFKHVLTSIVAPTTLTTGGKILLASTPARTPGHESSTVARDMIDRGLCSTFTIRDAPHITHEEKVDFLVHEMGEKPERADGILDGTLEPETTDTLRELFCRLDVTDAESAVIPEFTAQAQAQIVKEHPRPRFYNAYVGMDPGMTDKTGLLFAYWDFKACKLVIEDEALLGHSITPRIAEVVKQKEADTFAVGCNSVTRVSDIDSRLIADLVQLHGLSFQKADKSGGNPAMINFLRTKIHTREIIIHPRCVKLIQQLRNCVWNSRATDFERTDADAHFDLVAALKYLVRVVNRSANPYPDWYRESDAPIYVSPKLHAKPIDIFSNTPFGRRLAKK